MISLHPELHKSVSNHAFTRAFRFIIRSPKGILALSKEIICSPKGILALSKKRFRSPTGILASLKEIIGLVASCLKEAESYKNKPEIITSYG